MLDIKNLNKSYQMGDSSLHVLKGIDLYAKSGEMVAIMGSSGSGKSTLLNIIGILDEADSGEYILDGVEIKDLNEQKAMFHLEKVGLKDWAKHLPNELSGGQKQRVAIARALASEPKLLLADEPTGALDTATSHEIMQFLQQLNDEGKTILLVTHEEDIAKMCKRIVRLRDGVIIEDNIIKQVRV